MNRIIGHFSLYFFGFLVLLGCTDSRVKSNKLDSKVINDTLIVKNAKVDSQFVISPLVKYKPDTSIWKYSLLNSDSIDRIMRQIELDSNLQTSILNKDETQMLTLTFHPGSTRGEFSEFHVKYNVLNENNFLIMMEEDFITESSIKLGLTPEELNQIKGIADSISGDESQFIYYYKIEDIDSSTFLQRYNMPAYYSSYYFTNGKLTEFKFGFEYP